MRPRTPPLRPLLAPRARGCGLRRRRIEERRRRLGGECLLRLLERDRPRIERWAALGAPRPAAGRRAAVRVLALLLGEVLPPRVLRLALLPHGEERSGDED